MQPPSSIVIALRAAAGAVLSPGQIEALKWAALALMLLDHVNSYLLDKPLPWMFHVGRAAFPLFAVALGLALAADPIGQATRALFRLAPFAVAAQIGSQIVRDEVVLNILFLFIAACAWVVADDEPAHRRFALYALATLVASFAEFGLPGFAFVVCAWRFIHQGSPLHLFGAFGALGVVAGVDSSPGSLLAVLAFAAVMLLRLEVPRNPGFFAWAYVLQFPAFICLRWLHG